jgi:hypothetical protein
MLKQKSLKLGHRLWCPMLLALVGACAAPVDLKLVQPAKGPWTLEEVEIVEIVVDALFQKRFGSDWEGHDLAFAYFGQTGFWLGLQEELEDTKAALPNEENAAKLDQYMEAFHQRVKDRGPSFQSAFANFLAQERLNAPYQFPEALESNWGLITTELDEKYFDGENADGHRQFQTDFPNAYGPYALERPAISNDAKVAMVRMSFSGVEDHYGDNFYVLRKRSGHWVLLEEQFDGPFDTLCIIYQYPPR